MKDEFRVGQLAKRTGVSVRTLHYYEEIGLLKPAYRTAADHRVYGREEVAQLRRIRSLVHLGFSLEEVKGCLADPDFALERVLALHIERLDRTIDRLRSILEQVRAAEDVSVHELLKSIKETTMLEKHYTPDQLEALEKRRKELGEEGMARAQAQWAALIGDVRAAMEHGDDPESEPVLELARRWQRLVAGFTGGDAGTHQSLGNVWKHEGDELRRQHGDSAPSPEMFEYIGRATRAL